MFVRVGIAASAALIKGLNDSSLESALSKAIQPVDDQKAKDYDEPGNRVLFLVDNYDPVRDEADAIGVLTINWRLFIKDYKKKKEALKHDAKIIISTRAVLYDSIEALKDDEAFVRAHFGKNMFTIPPKRRKLKIFETLPQPNKDTFDQGLPAITKEDYSEVIVLFAPNLELIGSLDNTASDIASTYSKSVSSGFTFTASQTFSSEFEFEAGIVFAKAKLTVGFSLTFTEQWNKSQTETMEFTVPARERAFTYQGVLQSYKLRYMPGTDTYKYHDRARFVTNIIKTSEEPIEDLTED